MTPNVLIATRSFGSTSPKPLEILHGAGCDLVHADMSLEMTEKRLIDLLKGAMEFDMKVLGTGGIDNFEKIKDMIPLGRSYSPVAEDAKRYHELYLVYKQLYSSLGRSFGKIANLYPFVP